MKNKTTMRSDRTPACLPGSAAAGAVAVAALLVVLGNAVSADSAMAGPFESYFLYNGAFPDSEETSYSGECSNNTQGITHDDNNWFFSMTEELWKIPVQYDLRHVNDSSQYPGVIHVRMFDVPQLVQRGFYHIGAIYCYNAYGQNYIIAPIEARIPPQEAHAIVVFRADDLQYLCHTDLPGYRDLGWVAIDPDGVLYVSHDSDSRLQRYYADWDQLPAALPLTEMPPVDLVRQDGTPFNTGHAQGAVFSPSGSMFYFLSGIHDQHDPDEGISAFIVDNYSLTWRCVKRSYQGDDYQPFWYHFDPGSPDYEEPEGITIWDLDDGRAPGILGQMHAVMLDNDSDCTWSWDDDDVTIYHYRNTIHANRLYAGTEETGEPHKPFKTIAGANNLAWDGCRIAIQAGTYSETLVFTRRMEVSAIGGSVLMGDSP